MSDAGWAGRVLAWLGDPPYHERVWNHKHDASAPHHDEAKEEEEEADGEIYGGTRPKDINAMHFLLTYAKYQSLKKGRFQAVISFLYLRFKFYRVIRIQV